MTFVNYYKERSLSINLLSNLRLQLSLNSKIVMVLEKGRA